MISNDIDQGLLFLSAILLVMFAFPFVMAWMEESLGDPPREPGTSRWAWLPWLGTSRELARVKDVAERQDP